MSIGKSGKVMRIFLGLLATLFLLLSLAIVSVWAPDRPLESLTARWATLPSQFLSIDGMQVHVRDEGPRTDPQPIVLLHGTSDSLHTWAGWTTELSKSRRVIRMDLPGFGLTGPSPDNDYRMSRYVRFVSALYDHFQLEHSVLAGNSLGGAIAWNVALAMPKRVDALILVDAAGYPTTSTSAPLAFRLARMPLLAPLMSNILPRGVIESSVRNVYGDPTRVKAEQIDRFYELALRAGNRAALGERFRQTVWGEGSERIRQITQPTLILWGDKDQLIPLEHGERFHKDIAGSSLVRFATLGHVPQEEDPAATVSEVSRFITQQTSRTTTTPGI
jgi:pimeloyl-ACP methyl ester carboxylesterase